MRPSGWFIVFLRTQHRITVRLSYSTSHNPSIQSCDTVVNNLGSCGVATAWPLMCLEVVSSMSNSIAVISSALDVGTCTFKRQSVLVCLRYAFFGKRNKLCKITSNTHLYYSWNEDCKSAIFSSDDCFPCYVLEKYCCSEFWNKLSL